MPPTHVSPASTSPPVDMVWESSREGTKCSGPWPPRLMVLGVPSPDCPATRGSEPEDGSVSSFSLRPSAFPVNKHLLGALPWTSQVTAWRSIGASWSFHHSTACLTGWFLLILSNSISGRGGTLFGMRRSPRGLPPVLPRLLKIYYLPGHDTQVGHRWAPA